MTRSVGDEVRLAAVVMSLAVTLGACQDDTAVLQGPVAEVPLAVGGYHALSISPCPGGIGGGIPVFCTAEPIARVVEARSEDPTIAEIIPRKDHPGGILAIDSYFVLGKRVGRTSVIVKGPLDDGSIGESRIIVHVSVPDSFKAWACGTSASTNLLVRTDDAVSFYLTTFAGSDTLMGWLPGAVKADGLTEMYVGGDAVLYVWRAPVVPAVIPVQSSIVPGVNLTLTAFGPTQVTRLYFDAPSSFSSPLVYTQPGKLLFRTLVLVQDQIPCHPQQVDIHSATPSICSGPAGETDWQVDTGTTATATVTAGGSCILTAGLAGGSVTATQTFPIVFGETLPVAAH